jgi:hypothetical protein
MEPGTLTWPPVRDATEPQEVTVDLIDPTAVIGATMRGGEKDRLGRPVTDDIDIVLQTLGESGRQGNQTVFAELALMNGEDARLQIDIADV